MTAYVVSSGVTSSGLILRPADTLTVLAGGTTLSITDAGVEWVSSGGVAALTTVVGGGLLVLSAGAFGANEIVSSGGVISGPGVLFSADDHGAIDGVTVGLVTASRSAGGVFTVESGGVARGVTVAFSDGVEVKSGGRTQAMVLDSPVNGSDAMLIVDAGGSASGTLIKNGDIAANGVITGTVIESGLENIFSGGESLGTTVSSGGAELVEFGGVASGAVVLSRGSEQINSGGKTLGGAVESGALLFLAPGATASGVTVASGGTAYLGVVSAGTIVLGPTSAAKTVTDGVSFARGAIIGLQSAMISSGAVVDLAIGGNIDGGVVSAGATVSGPGALIGSILDDGVIDGAAIGIILSGFPYGGGIDVGSGGVISGATEKAGLIVVQSGGVAEATVLSGARAAGSAELQVESGGASVLTSLRSGGVEVVSSGAVASETIVSKGGIVSLTPGAALVGAVLLSGATLSITSGESATGTVVSRGGAMTVSSGGAVTGSLALAGGTAILNAGALDAGVVVSFAGSGGDLAIASGGVFSGKVEGLGAGDKLDVGGFAYNATGETLAFVSSAGGSGTLTLSSGGHTESLTLNGVYATSNFALSTDSHGGTFIRWVSRGGFAVEPKVQPLAAAMAAFDVVPGGALHLPQVSSSTAPLLLAGRS
jgi:autotransporter passenger strand-loop-strand repeat protein